MANQYRVVAYLADGQVVKRFTVEDEQGDGPLFYAHQVLHVDGVVCVEIFDAALGDDSPAVHVQCDPGVDFTRTVHRAGLG